MNRLPYQKLETVSKIKVVILATAGQTTDVLYNALDKEAEVSRVFIEPHESKLQMLKRRFKKPGPIKTLGQIAFLLFAQPFIPSKKARINRIISEYDLSGKAIPNEKITQIESVHATGLAEQIMGLKPDIIVVNGTRILKKALLEKLTCPIVNIHVGITPKYRGVHGGYWALFHNDSDLFGVTLHYIDSGIDTGRIIAQKVIPVDAEDNYKTYPILQYVNGVLLLKKHLKDIQTRANTNYQPLTQISCLHYHPTLCNYIFGKAK